MNDSGYVDEADKKDLARKIGVAAVKFGDLIDLGEALLKLFDGSFSVAVNGRRDAHCLI